MSGRVVDENLEIAPLVTIYDKDTTEIGKTDLDGYFEIELPKETKKIIFAGLGYEWATITIPNECKTPEIILFLEYTYDFMSSKKIDRLRKKRFDKLTELHFQTFKKGLFKTDKPCVTRNFEPYKPELDRIAKLLNKQAKENKNDFKNLEIGDSVKIPFGLDSSEKRISTHYSPCKNCTEKDYDYVIEGEIINKHSRKLTLEIKITEMKPYDSLKYNGKILTVGSDFKYEMKYFEVILDK
ncbi:carboxypeptidase-like regulatory domain-containing protein [Zhouia sp. PK063]|uniref:carboxypeptidase-like regulatory domain-containing protein n=1 Tax=Zhouia sp. PK063 TaxID=3373602 RepID=UPI0037946E89